MAENQEAIKDAIVKAKGEEKQEDIEEKHEKVARNLENIYAEKLRQKAVELDAIEKAIDKKIDDFKDFLAKTALGGRGIAAIEKDNKSKEADAMDAKVNKLMAFGR